MVRPTSFMYDIHTVFVLKYFSILYVALVYVLYIHSYEIMTTKYERPFQITLNAQYVCIHSFVHDDQFAGYVCANTPIKKQTLFVVASVK